MATASVQPNRSQKQRVLQAPEKAPAPASSAHAAASVKASSVSHTHEKVRVVPGVQHSASNQAMQRMVRGRVLQRKLAINRPGDIYEQEADRVADAVMRMPASAPTLETVRESGLPSRLQRCSCGKPVTSGEQCEACKTQGTRLQRSPTTSSENTSAPPIVHDVLNSAGRPLDAATRQFMEPRFGHDFSNVRVHTGSQAAESARAVNALAYTVGNNVVFGSGQYAPSTQAGGKLLAHELAHTLQQESQEPGQLSRKCGPQGFGPTPKDCNLIQLSAADQPKGQRFLFNVNCDDFAPGEQAKLEDLLDPKTLQSNDTIEIVGLASFDGDASFNEALSCSRAATTVKLITQKGFGSNIKSVSAAGGVAGTTHDATFRAVDVLLKKCVDLKQISSDKDPLPPTPAYAPQSIPGKDLPVKLKELFDQANKNLIPIPPVIPKGTLGFTLPMLPAVFTTVSAPSVTVEAQDVDGSDCKKCVAEWKLQRPQVLSFAAQGFIVPESRFWINQDHDRRQCPSTGTFGDKKDVRVLITPEAHQKIIEGEKEHFLDAQRTFDLTGGRYLANALRLTSARTPLRATNQQECRNKVADFLERLAGSPGVIGQVGREGLLNGGYTGLFVKDFLDEFQASGKERDDTKKHTAISKPPSDRPPIAPNFDTAINPFGCDAFFRKDDKDSFPGIPGAKSEDVIKDLDTPVKLPWHQL
jgi:outer membrane protein OmpA-like peptidoglycan-associated protein